MKEDSDVFNVYKPVGISPLGAIKLFKQKHPEYADVKMTYAGRLDPLAEGVLLLLVGEAVHKKDEYLKLDKTYEAEILFGFETDTYDVLGLPSRPSKQASESSSKPGFGTSLKPGFFPDSSLEKFRGKFSFSLPPFSSYKIKGKPLFWWAREGRLEEIEIPKRETEIFDIELLDFSEITSANLLAKINQKIDTVQGDFRQEEIRSLWAKMLGKTQQESFYTAKIRVHCSSGTYIRSLAHQLGKNLKTSAVLLGLKRTTIGNFGIRK